MADYLTKYYWPGIRPFWATGYWPEAIAYVTGTVDLTLATRSTGLTLATRSTGLTLKRRGD